VSTVKFVSLYPTLLYPFWNVLSGSCYLAKTDFFLCIQIYVCTFDDLAINIFMRRKQSATILMKAKK